MRLPYASLQPPAEMRSWRSYRHLWRDSDDTRINSRADWPELRDYRLKVEIFQPEITNLPMAEGRPTKYETLQKRQEAQRRRQVWVKDWIR
ncbi:hypothetical protein EYF80_054331 [Liparis tanakae]|uniref:Uncharacterized protein n=1 Tax=Liparis tanakae TaxID=230148 RepID=A0A4Z2F380_9TELE|nr:hypothetical protein EYF80_054331 [Liparis tanakae]